MVGGKAEPLEAVVTGCGRVAPLPRRAAPRPRISASSRFGVNPQSNNRLKTELTTNTRKPRGGRPAHQTPQPATPGRTFSPFPAACGVRPCAMDGLLPVIVLRGWK